MSRDLIHDSMKLNFQKNKAYYSLVAKISTIGFLIVSLFGLALVAGTQFQSFEPDGKGDSGHLRDWSHPFVCSYQSNFTSRPILSYCDASHFADDLLHDWRYRILAVGLLQIYLIGMAIIIPLSILIKYNLQKKKGDKELL